MPKLLPPGQSSESIHFRYPASSGPIHSYSVVSTHAQTNRAHIHHGGQYNLLVGCLHLGSHAQLLVQEARLNFTHWAKQAVASSIIVSPRMQRGIDEEVREKVEDNPIMVALVDLEREVRHRLEAIQADLVKAEAEEEAQVLAEVEKVLPKNGADLEHLLEDDAVDRSIANN